MIRTQALKFGFVWHVKDYGEWKNLYGHFDIPKDKPKIEIV
jgi:hypothetical protein